MTMKCAALAALGSLALMCQGVAIPNDALASQASALRGGGGSPPPPPPSRLWWNGEMRPCFDNPDEMCCTWVGGEMCDPCPPNMCTGYDRTETYPDGTCSVYAICYEC